MKNKKEGTSLVDAQGRAVALQSVHASGELSGLFLRMKLRQVYRNTTEQNLETVFTFPLAWGATLLGMAVVLNGKQLQGKVVEKAAAKARYEAAIDSGDMPVMVTKSGKDVYTAHLGNLQPGDEVDIEIDYGQLLRIERGQLRISLPTTIAPRFGDAPGLANRAAHLLNAVNPLAEYRFFLTLDIKAPLSTGLIASPSHAIELVPKAQGTTIKLARKAMLDRDFVVTVGGLDDLAFAVASPDPGEPGTYTLLGSFVARLPSVAAVAEPVASPVRMKVLVDCSGSMQGDSMAQAKVALASLCDHLESDDLIAFSRFGSHTANVISQLLPCTRGQIAQLRDAVEQTQADMGGTELDSALQSVIKIKAPQEREAEACSILLITDGEVWNIDNIVATVRQSGHRIYAIGVGSSPAESLLRELAEVSGGACEMVSPKQSMHAAVLRLVERIRYTRHVQLAMHADTPTIWESCKPSHIVDMETVHQWLQVGTPPHAPPIMHCTDLMAAGTPQIVTPSQLVWNEDGALARMCAAQRLHDVSDAAEIRRLALKYQLVTEQTHLFLVHERAAGEKADTLPELQQIENMLAAGWGGNGTVMDKPMFSRKQADAHIVVSYSMDSVDSSLQTRAVWRSVSSNDTDMSPRKMARSYASLAQLILYAKEPDNPLTKILMLLNKQNENLDFVGLKLMLQKADFPVKAIDVLLDELTQLLGSREIAWGVFFDWLNVDTLVEPKLTRGAMRIIRRLSVSVDNAAKIQAFSLLQRESTDDAQLSLRLGDGFSDYEIPAFMRKSNK